MRENGGVNRGLGPVLAIAEAAAPVDAVDVLAAELASNLGAEHVSFLVADYSGNALVRLSRTGAGAGRRSRGQDAATTIPLTDTIYAEAIREQRVQVLPEGDGVTVVAPVTNRGDVIGALELRLLERPDADVIAYIGSAAHILGYVVIANDRFTDLFEWGQRSAPMSLAGEIQRRLLPNALTCEAGQFTIAGALEPAGHVGGDTFDYSLERETLHVSLTDAMGHGTDAALLASLLVGSLRNSRRQGASITEQAAAAHSTLDEHSSLDQFATGQLLRVDLASGSAHIVNCGHPGPLRLRDGRVDTIELDTDLPFGIASGARFSAQPLELQPGDRLVLVTDGILERNPVHLDIPELMAGGGHLHPREVVQQLTRAVADAAGDDMSDDATALCLDWYGAVGSVRQPDSGADSRLASGGLAPDEGRSDLS